MTVINGEVVCLILGSTLGIGKKSEYEVAHSSKWEAAAPNLPVNRAGFLFYFGWGVHRAVFFSSFL